MWALMDARKLIGWNLRKLRVERSPGFGLVEFLFSLDPKSV